MIATMEEPALSGEPSPRRGRGPSVVDPLWRTLLEEAESAREREPALSQILLASILSRASLEEAITHRIASRLGSDALAPDAIRDVFADVVAADAGIGGEVRRDLRAVRERDPACTRFLDAILFFKGFHALQCHRVAHRLWRSGRRDLALYLQSRASEVFGTDIHPAARLGSGLFLDHATGFVVGETAVIEDDVSILHGVTLGGTGVARGDRHPKVRRGSLLGAGALILGAVEVGEASRVAAGSLVLHHVPPCTTVAGVPARVVGAGGSPEPAREMDQRLDPAAYEAFAYVI